MRERDKVPPAVPDELQPLERAILLLGHCANGNLRSKGSAELVQLVGRLPRNAEQATAWKSELKRVRKDEIFSS